MQRRKREVKSCRILKMKTDVAIVGGGAAGLAAALCIPSHLQVAVFVKRRLPDCASAWAQGGIAAALAPDDQADSHAADTLQAGDGLCNREAVHSIVADAPDTVRWLAKQGVAFNLQGEGGDAFSLGREGGHSARRIAHADDMTGSAVVSALAAQVARRDNIRIVERAIAVNLSADGGACRGFYALLLQSGKIEEVNARAVLLASGGGGKVYLYATTPPDATGDGAAMAYRLGCPIANMEFVQFHPTCLYHPQAAAFLVTEAMRGEGARLMNAAGDYFLENSGHSELSSRDIVARAIDGDMKKSGADCVYLDLSSRPPEFWRRRFPAIMRRCRELGLPSGRIPVVPAAHYCCGGIQTDLQGRAGMPGLWAAGEAAHTGMHGANRLASNSLLECIVIARRAAAAMAEELPPQKKPMPAWDERRISAPSENVMVAHNWEELRRLMWNYVGIVRGDGRLSRARRRLEWIGEEIEEHYRLHAVSRDFLELRNLVQCARLIVEGALSRRESRGLHFNRDCPQKLSRAADTVFCRDDFLRKKQAANRDCPFSGRGIVANGLLDYRGKIVGFCNPACRDNFAAAAATNFNGADEVILAARKKLDALVGN